MTSPTGRAQIAPLPLRPDGSAHGIPRASRREQLVAAAIVGMVVVILGFASGAGVEVTHFSANGQLSPRAGGTAPPSSMPARPSPSAPPAVNYVGVPIGGTVALPAPAGLAGPPAVTSAPAATASSVPTPETAPRPASTSPASPPAPVATCSTDLVSSLLNALTGNASQGLGGVLPLGAPLSLLTQGLGLQLPALPLSDLLSQVTDLLPVLLTLPVGGRPTSSSPALAAACTTALSTFLPIPGLGG